MSEPTRTTWTPTTSACATCGEQNPPAANFCEGCGAQLGSVDEEAAARSGPPPTESAPISRPTRAGRRTDPPPPEPRACRQCGGTIGAEDYCEQCGVKAPRERDHFREQPAPWAAGVCDRGIVHHRNEDAMALWATPDVGGRAVLVVCDGVSSSADSDVASLAGARAARDVLRGPLPQGMGTEGARDAAVTRVLTEAARAARDAVIANTAPESDNPASATFTVAVSDGSTIWHGNVGDSRCYWVPDVGEAMQLTVDDSAAQQAIASGVPREEAESGPYAHAITRWLGRDGEDWEPSVGGLTVTANGWLLACSDGLWNYASTPAELAAQVRGAGSTDPAAIALALVDFANAAGGRDNITVALARVDASATAAPGPTPDPTDELAEQEKTDG